jgi:hypothetical protein
MTRADDLPGGKARAEVAQLNQLLSQLLQAPRIGDQTETWDRIMTLIEQPRQRQAG